MYHALMCADQRIESRRIAVLALRYPDAFFVCLGHVIEFYPLRPVKAENLLKFLKKNACTLPSEGRASSLRARRPVSASCRVEALAQTDQRFSLSAFQLFLFSSSAFISVHQRLKFTLRLLRIFAASTFFPVRSSPGVNPSPVQIHPWSEHLWICSNLR